MKHNSPLFKHILNAIKDLPSSKQENLASMIFHLIEMEKNDTAFRSDLNIIEATIKELYDSFNVFSKYDDIRKVSIFGSARTPEDNDNYKLTVQVAQDIVKKGFLVITGAGGGIMEAGNKGAGPEKSFGVNIDLPFEQMANPYIMGSEKLMDFKYFFNRKLIFIKESDATILFPGGFGTHDEGFEVLTLIQTGRCAPRPVVLMNHKNSNYWNRWIHFIDKELNEKHYISPEDMSLFKFTDSSSEAVDYIVNFYSTYHSLRYIGTDCYIRLNKPISKATLKDINAKFKDIMPNGEAVLKKPGEFKLDTQQFKHLHRLIIPFNNASFARLSQLIHFING